jgi:hypothetical protein
MPDTALSLVTSDASQQRTGRVTLLERKTALDALTEIAEQAHSGEGRLVLVEGEAGVGKSALLEQFTHDLPDSRLLSGACDLRVVTTTAAFGLPEIKVGVPSVIDAALLPGFVGLSKAREMILTGDTYRLDQLPPHSIANVITEPGLLAEATERLLERTATHTRTVTAAQRRLFSLWLNNPLDAAVEHSTDEFAGTFGAQETRDQIAYHHRRITGRSS